MNGALFYLWFALLKRQARHFCRGLRRPTTLVGVLALAVLVGFLFHFRRHEIVAHLAESRVLAGGAILMFCAALFRGFLQRGLVFGPADLDFLFTAPFTQRQIIVYRLLPDYVYALFQGVVFLILFGSQFSHPWLAGVCVVLFQFACFHLATAAAIFGGTIGADLHHRLRWMLLGIYFLLLAFYLRAGWQLKLVPGFLSGPLMGFFFYPAVTLPDIANAPDLHRWVLNLAPKTAGSINQTGRLVCYLGGFLAGAVATLWPLLRVKTTNLFEPSLAISTRRAEKLVRLHQGRTPAETPSGRWRSARLPRLGPFYGVGAVVWKNLVVAGRSRRELLWVSAFAFIYTGFTMALLYLYHYYSTKADVPAPRAEASGFYIGVALFLAGLTFFLQRMVPFDFRRDGQHLLGFRTLPVSAFGLALAQLGVPTLFCLVLQAPCILALLWYAQFPITTLLLVVLSYPAVALALNSVWNLHYLLAAAKRAAKQDVTAVGTLLVVALSFLVFYPAGWIMLWIGHNSPSTSGIQLPLGAGLLVQYLIDASLILLLARLFQRLELSENH